LNVIFTTRKLNLRFTRIHAIEMPPSKNSNISLRKPSRSSSKQQATLTREQLAADLEAFRKAGGKIERLGNTNTFKKIG